MSIVLVTGSAGLIGSTAVRFFCERSYDVVGIDNNMRKYFFGEDACVNWNVECLVNEYPRYTHLKVDIRDKEKIKRIFSEYNKDIILIVHAAAQPSHDWAALNPWLDFEINANGTLNLLENYRIHCPNAVFTFCSTNKVYGDNPNHLPLIEQETKFEIDNKHQFYDGINETMSIDQSTHSVFGASKVAADVMVQEYGRYFNLKTGVFRGGCLTGPAHSGTEYHGFLSYLMRCCISKKGYKIFGYKGKQVRDNIHSYDFISALFEFFNNPRSGQVYNIGGGRSNHCSVLEAIKLCENVTGNNLDVEYMPKIRVGDHKWWVTSLSKFKSHYPSWKIEYDIRSILHEIYEVQQGVSF